MADESSLSAVCLTFSVSHDWNSHTRNGLQKGEDDARSCGFLHIIELLKKIEKKPKYDFLRVKTLHRYILLENVEGFEVSGSHDQFIDALTECKYNYQVFSVNSQMMTRNSSCRPTNSTSQTSVTDTSS